MRIFKHIIVQVCIAFGLLLLATSRAQTGPNGLVFFGDRTIKDSVGSSAPISQVAVGFYHTIAVRKDGTVVAWGYNRDQECDVPNGITNAIQVAAGDYHSLVLLADGTVRAFGAKNFGQCAVPIGLSNVTKVAAGGGISMALRSNGTVVCWGDPTSGVLQVPASVNNVLDIAAGANHCLALKGDGTVIAWGNNGYGQISVPSSNVGAVRVAANAYQSGAVLADGTVAVWGSSNNGYGPPSNLSGVTQLALGSGSGFALKADGSLVCWGPLAFGLMTPPAVSGLSQIAACQTGAVALTQEGHVLGWGDGFYGHTTTPENLTNLQTIATGAAHVAFLRNNGTIAVWGSNRNHQTELPSVMPYAFKSISCGHFFTTALATNGSFQMFGDNTAGQLNSPAGLITDAMYAAGATTFAHKLAGGFAAWGNNGYGQFSLVSALSDVVQIAGDFNEAYALRTDGTVTGIGDNYWGQMNIPSGLANVIQLSTSSAHAIALKADGTVATWGNNAYYQNDFPMGLSNVMQVAAGAGFCAALKTDGSVVAWGNNASGQSTPPDGLIGMAQIAAGDEFMVCLPRMSLVVGPYQVYGGDAAVGKVYLPTPAPKGGTLVQLSSSDPNAMVPSSVTVLEGNTVATFVVTTLNPSAPIQAIITATLGGLNETALVSIKPADFTIATNVGSIVGGSVNSASLTINLKNPAPANGATILFTSVDPALSIPAQVTIPAGAKSYFLPIGHSRVHVQTPAFYTASYLNTTRIKSVMVMPFQLTNFTVSGSSFVGGNLVPVQYSLNAASQTPIDVQVTSSNSASLPSPGTVTIGANTTGWSSSFPSTAVSATTPVSLTASLDGSTFTRSLNLISALGLQSVQSSTVGGSTNVVTMTVSLAAPAPSTGAFVSVQSSDPSATVNSPITIMPGATSATFTVSHSRVTSPKTVTISASYAGSTVSVPLTLNPFRVTSFNATATNWLGGTTVPIKVALNATPLAAISVPISSSDTATVPTPNAITVPALSSGGNGTFTSKTVGLYTAVTLTASLDGSSVDLPLKIQPALSTLVPLAPSVWSCTSTGVILTLTQPAPSSGLTVNLSGVNCQFLTSTFNIPPGAQTVIIPVTANSISAPDSMKVTVTYGVEKLVATMTLMPNAITSFTITPSTFTGSSSTVVTLSVSLSAKVAYDTFVTLTNSDPAHVTVPSVLKIAAGTDTTTITVPHSKVLRADYVTITASYGGGTKSVQLTLFPG